MMRILALCAIAAASTMVRPAAAQVPDESRSVDRVQRVVLQRHGDLFRSLDSGSINQLTIVLDEQGEIVKEQVESQPVLGGRSFRTVRPTPQSFAQLGLEADKIGVIGMTQMSLPRTADPRPVVGPDGIASGLTGPVILLVRYAWPRRPGEPVGGESSVALGAAPNPDQIRQLLANRRSENSLPVAQLPPQSQILSRLAQEQFPAGSASNGNWMLVSSNWELLRKGHVDLAAGQQLTDAWLQRLMPGLVLSGGMSMGFGALRAPTRVQIFILAPESALPPPAESGAQE